MGSLITRRARIAALGLLLSGIGAVAHGQMCPIPGNPCGGGDSASQSGVNGPTGVGNPIDVTNGNKYQLETDVLWSGELAAVFRRHYNSLAAESRELGRGWRHGYDTRLTRQQLAGKTPEAPPKVTIRVTQADGRVIEFVSMAKGAGATPGVHRYVSNPAGYGVIEERDADVARLRRSRNAAVGVVGEDATLTRPWRWTWANGRRLDFDGRGLTRRIANLQGEFVELDYDGQTRLIRVRDANARELRMSYWDDAQQRLREFKPGATAASEAAGGARGRLRSLVSPDGRTIEYGYNSDGMLSEVRFGDGTRTRYEYVLAAGSQRLAKITGRDGKTIGEYAYDAAGRAVRSSAPGGLNAVELEYRLDAKVAGRGDTWLKNSQGEVSVYRWRYAAAANESQLVEALGPGCATCATTNVRYEYDTRGRVSRIERLAPGARAAWETSPKVERVETVEYDGAGRFKARYRLLGATRELLERWEYAGENPADLRPTLIARPSVRRDSETTIALTYDADGRTLSMTERGFAPDARPQSAGYLPLERVTRYGYYDGSAGAAVAGKLRFIDGPLAGDGDTSRYEYDASGLLRAVKHPEGLAEKFSYDALARLIEHVAADTLPTRYEYDARGLLTRMTRAGLKMELGYDERGRLVTLADPIGQRLSMSYDAASRVLSIEDTQKNRIEYDRDAEGHVLAERLRAPDGSVASEREATEQLLDQRPELAGLPRWTPPPRAFRFAESVGGDDARVLGELGAPGSSSLFDGRGFESRVVRDDFGRFAYSTDRDIGRVDYTYDAGDRLVERTGADGWRTKYEYDLVGRVRRVVTADDDVRIDYGAYGKPVHVVFAAGEERFEYNEQGEPVEHTRVIDGHTFTTRNRLDDFGRLVERKLPDGTRLRYRYNPSMHAKPGVLAAIERIDLLGSTNILSGLNEADDGYRSSSFLFGNGLESLRELDSHGAYVRFGTPGIAEFRTSADAGGRVRTAVGTSGADSFEYGDDGRLTGMARALSADQITLARGFKYDAAGNLLRATSAPGALQSYGIDGGSNRVLYRLDADGTRTEYRYDAAGRIVAIGGRSFEYDRAGRLARVLEVGKPIAEYRYNSFGERIRKVVWSAGKRSVTYFLYDDAQLTAEADEGGEITRQYLYHEAAPVALLANGEVYAVHTDWRGAPVAVTNDARAVVWHAEIDAYGAARVAPGSFALNLRESNQYFDAESGLHYNTHRFYDPSMGRYLTPDPLGPAASRNVYAFAEGDPANFVDLNGLQQTPARKPFAQLTLQDKVAYVFNRAADLYPGEVGEALRQMVSLRALATTAAILGAWAASHAFGVGEVADVIMAGVAWFFIGKSVVDVLHALVDASLGIANATCYEDLDRAGQRLADGAREVTVALAASAGAAAVSKVGGMIRNLLGRAPAVRNPPPRAVVPPPVTLAQLVNESRSFSRFISMSRTPAMPRNDGRLGEQVAKQILEAETRATFRSIQNASGNGADLVRINPVTRTIEHVEVKSSQVGTPGWPDNLANRFTNWINEAAGGTLSGQRVSADTQAYAAEIQRLIAQGYTVEHRVAQVTIPPAGQTGSALFRLFNWP